MAIGRPEATDGAPRRGSTAEEKLSCFARNDGLRRQGKKASTAPLRPGGRGVSRPSARSGHRRGRIGALDPTETDRGERGGVPQLLGRQRTPFDASSVYTETPSVDVPLAI